MIKQTSVKVSSWALIVGERKRKEECARESGSGPRGPVSRPMTASSPWVGQPWSRSEQHCHCHCHRNRAGPTASSFFLRLIFEGNNTIQNTRFFLQLFWYLYSVQAWLNTNNIMVTRKFLVLSWNWVKFGLTFTLLLLIRAFNLVSVLYSFTKNVFLLDQNTNVSKINCSIKNYNMNFTFSFNLLWLKIDFIIRFITVI